MTYATVSSSSLRIIIIVLSWASFFKKVVRNSLLYAAYATPIIINIIIILFPLARCLLSSPVSASDDDHILFSSCGLMQHLVFRAYQKEIRGKRERSLKEKAKDMIIRWGKGEWREMMMTMVRGTSIRTSDSCHLTAAIRILSSPTYSFVSSLFRLWMMIIIILISMLRKVINNMSLMTLPHLLLFLHVIVSPYLYLSTDRHDRHNHFRL